MRRVERGAILTTCFTSIVQTNALGTKRCSSSSGFVFVAGMGGRKVEEFTEEDSEVSFCVFAFIDCRLKGLVLKCLQMKVLVKIVKAAQSRNVKGSKGEWKDFLRSSRQLRVGPSDPAKRPWTTLADFVRTFTDDAIQMVKQIRAFEVRKKNLGELEAEGIREDSPKQELVRLTRQHFRFQEYYTFPSFDKGWVMTDLKKPGDQSKQEHMLSMDCEMVVCDDNQREIVQVCVVNDEEKVVLDMLVKPKRPVRDYLTPITGICEADLKNVTCGFLEAQIAVLKLLTADTILVGHSLHNDLIALKIDHPRVIDTSFLFQICNKPESFSVGLNSLCKAVLGYDFRDDGKPHDCLLDATIPMRIVQHILNHGLKGPIKIQEKMLDKGELCKLYFHRIPQPVSVNDLQKLIPDDCPCNIDAISWTKNKSGTAYGVFSCIDDANRVFEKLTGLAGEDSNGRPQKTVMVTVFSKHGKSKKVPVRVRKMLTAGGVQGEGAQQALATATECSQSVQNIELAALKKRKVSDGDSCITPDKAVNHCCEHFQEAESLRKKLREKIEEVHALQKIILDLTKEQF